MPHVIEMTSRYKNSPAIAMWEIINEPGEADWKTIRDFLHEIVAARHVPSVLWPCVRNLIFIFVREQALS